MKIAINAIPYSNWSGIETFLYNILKFWPYKDEDEIVVFTNKSFSPLLTDLPKHIKIREISLKKTSRLNLFLYQQIVFPFILKAKNFDALFCPSLITPWLFKNKITTIHDAAPFILKNENSLTGKIFWHINLWFSLQTSKRIVTVSEFSKKELIKHLKINKEKIDVIYNGAPIINTPLYLNQPKDKNYLLVISNARPHKNLEILFQAMKLIKESEINLKLFIVGKIDEKMSNLQNKYFDENIVFLDFIEEQKKYNLIKNSVALVFPSLYEGFGLPIIEAGILKTPVICSDIPAFREVAGNSALFFNPQDKNDLIEKIMRIINSKEASFNLGNSGFINSRRFSWLKSAEKLSSIIKNYENPTNK